MMNSSRYDVCAERAVVLSSSVRRVLQGTIKAARQALSQVDAANVRGVGVSGQQHGMVVLDSQDKVLRPAKVSACTAAGRHLDQQFSDSC